MRFNFTAALLATATVVAAKPFKFPLGNGFPAPKPKALEKIQEHAGGFLPPSSGLPAKLSKEATTTFQLIALNEIFEVAYFTELLKNVTDGKPGYKVSDKKYIKRVFRRIRAQEELHSLGANGILANVKAPTIGIDCEYQFPVNSFDSAVLLAETFTSIVLAVVPGAQELFGKDGGDEVGLIPLVGSIIAQEGEQTGWFRSYQGKVPSAAPFLTGGAAQFAFSAIQAFLVPGKCPEANKIDIPIYPPLTVVKAPTTPKNQMITFSVENAKISKSGMSIAYISGQEAPVTVPIKKVMTKGKTTTIEAAFPFASGKFSKGLTFAAVVKGTKPSTSVTEVADKAMYGPGLIIID